MNDVLRIEQEQGWRSGESARLPQMWPGFDSRTRRHMWVEFVVGSLLCSKRFLSGFSGSLLFSKTNISNSNSILECMVFLNKFFLGDPWVINYIPTFPMRKNWRYAWLLSIFIRNTPRKMFNSLQTLSCPVPWILQISDTRWSGSHGYELICELFTDWGSQNLVWCK